MDEYISRKDAFGILQSRLDSTSQMSYLNLDWHELDIMRDTIQNAIDDIGEVTTADVQPVDRWISVEDRLPENCIEVLVYDTDCGIVIGWYDKEIGDFAADFISPLDAVTHWQPLPEPPKDGDTNE